MKKLFSTLVVLTVVSSVMLAGVDPGPTKSKSSNMAVVKCGNTVKVFYSKEDEAKVKVTIYDEKDVAVFTEKVKNHSGFMRPYKLDNLPKGNYRFVVEDESEFQEQNICNNSEKCKPMAAVIRANEDQVVVTLFSKVKNDVQIIFRNANHEVLLTEDYSITGGEAKLFNLEKIPGSVSVEVSDENGIIKEATISK